MKKKSCVLYVLIVFMWTDTLSAQNLLLNGAFDTDIDGWTNDFITAEWVSDDGAAISGNGSMRVIGTINNNSMFGMQSDSLAVQAGYWYLTAGSFKTPAISLSERGLYYIEWYDNSEQMILRDFVDSVYGVPDDVWIDMDRYLKAPEDAVSAVMRLMLQSGASGQTDLPFGLWDDAVLMQETLFSHGFD